jgi:hypothetical protein
MPTLPGDLPIDSALVGGTELAQRLNRILPDVVANTAAVNAHMTNPNPHPQYLSAAGNTAAATSFAPAGGVQANNVQGAIQELDGEKVNKAGSLADGTDLNTVVDSGFYRLQGNHPNIFTGGAYGQLLVIHGAADTIAQIGFNYIDGAMYSRSGNPSNVGGNGVWTQWRTTCWAGGSNASGTWGISTTGSCYGSLSGDGDQGIVNSANNAWRFKCSAGSNDCVSSGNVYAYSDLRLKTDLDVIGGALNKVQQLTGYTYTRIDTGMRQTGLVAQEVQKVLPEAVTSEKGMNEGDPETLSLAYGNMAGLFVEAIKELRAEVMALRAEVAELRGA